MAMDLTGGIDPSRELVFAERPENPEMRDSVSFWVVDDQGEIGLPRIGVEAVSANWDNHEIQVNVAFPDGLAFRRVAPFDTWTMTYDGKAVQTSSADEERLKNSVEGDLMGGPRYEQLFRAKGSVSVGGQGQDFT